MKFSIIGLFSKCDQIRRKLRIWSHSMKKSLMENFIFCAMQFKTNAPVIKTPVNDFKTNEKYESRQNFSCVASKLW